MGALGRFRPVVVIEVEDRHLRRNGRSADDVLGWFDDRGYAPHVLARDGLVAVDEVTLAHNNYVFLPAERSGAAA